MKLSDFTFGESFWMSGAEYLCVDIGTHYVIAIRLTDTIKADPSWLNGPPFAVSVVAFDAYDQKVCYLTKEEMDGAS